ncbi:hypothetical protein AAG906_026727 [Vitis piasezkii]
MCLEMPRAWQLGRHLMLTYVTKMGIGSCMGLRLGMHTGGLKQLMVPDLANHVDECTKVRSEIRGGKKKRKRKEKKSQLSPDSSTFTACSHSVRLSLSLSRKGAEKNQPKKTREDRSSNRKDHAYADQKLKEKIEVAELLMRKMSQFQDQPSTDHRLQEQEQEAQGNIHDPELIQEKEETIKSTTQLLLRTREAIIRRIECSGGKRRLQNPDIHKT